MVLVLALMLVLVLVLVLLLDRSRFSHSRRAQLRRLMDQVRRVLHGAERGQLWARTAHPGRTAPPALTQRLV